MKKGILLGVGELAMGIGRWLSPVERLKDIVGFFVSRSSGNPTEDMIEAKRYAICFYMFVKWTALIIFWFGEWSSWILFFLTFILMVFNLHSYIEHHIWNPVGEMTVERTKRRFLSLLQGIAFNIFGFAYLYRIHFGAEFSQERFNLSDPLIALCYGVLNTLGGGSVNAQNVVVEPSFWRGARRVF